MRREREEERCRGEGRKGGLKESRRGGAERRIGEEEGWRRGREEERRRGVEEEGEVGWRELGEERRGGEERSKGPKGMGKVRRRG